MILMFRIVKLIYKTKNNFILIETIKTVWDESVVHF